MPCRKNEKLKTLMQMISEDVRVQTFWRCANVMAIDRMGYSDHGPTHVKIVANSALRILRILVKRGVVPNVVKDYGLTDEDAEVIVVLASTLHDLGMAMSLVDGRIGGETIEVLVTFDIPNPDTL